MQTKEVIICIDPGLVNIAFIEANSEGSIYRWNRSEIFPQGTKCNSIKIKDIVPLTLQWAITHFPAEIHNGKVLNVFIESQMRAKCNHVQTALQSYFLLTFPGRCKCILIHPSTIKRSFDLSYGDHDLNKKYSVSRMLEIIDKLDIQLWLDPVILSFKPKLDDLADVWWMLRYALFLNKQKQ